MQTKPIITFRPIAFLSIKKMFLFFLLLLTPFFSNAQREEIGSLEIEGTAFLDGMKLKDAIITVYKDNVKDKEYRSKKKGDFLIDLSYGYNYKITFSYPGCIEMHIVVSAKIPKNKYIYNSGYGIEVPFFHTDDKTIDLSKYQFPFRKVIFNGKNGFMDDEKYSKEFEQGIFIEYVQAKELAKQEKEKKEKKTFFKKLAFAGKIFLGNNRNKPLANTKIVLVNEKGVVIQTAYTNAFGKFVFTELSGDQNLLLKIDESDNTKLAANTKITMTTKGGKEVMSTTTGPKGEFNFKFIAANQDVLNEMAVEDNSLVIAGNLLNGENSSKPVPNVKVILVNDKGEEIQTTTTNALGGFVFTKLPPDQNFIIKIDENDSKLFLNSKLLIATKNGKEIHTSSADASGKFSFNFLASDKNTLALLEVDDADLKTDLKGKLLSGGTKKALSGITVSLINDKGETAQTATTDAEGTFHFVNLPPDQSYMISIDEKNPELASLNQISLVDEEGKTIQEINADENKRFSFKYIPSDHKTLETIYVDDPWLKAINHNKAIETTTASVEDNSPDASDFSITNKELTIKENVYFDKNDYQLLPEATKLLDKVVDVMKSVPNISIELSSHTDSQGSKEYNMKLSEKRAKVTVDYIIAHGIDPKRISGKGYGETMLVNNCGDGVECPEEEHAKNRRLEFVIKRNPK